MFAGSLAQRPGGNIGLVSQLVGGLQDAFPGLALMPLSPRKTSPTACRDTPTRSATSPIVGRLRRGPVPICPPLLTTRPQRSVLALVARRLTNSGSGYDHPPILRQPLRCTNLTDYLLMS